MMPSLTDATDDDFGMPDPRDIPPPGPPCRIEQEFYRTWDKQADCSTADCLYRCWWEGVERDWEFDRIPNEWQGIVAAPAVARAA